METSDYWIKRVLEKLDNFSKLGADFKKTRWLFDWNNSKSVQQNNEQYRGESNALIHLANTGTISIESKLSSKVPLELEYYKFNEHGSDIPHFLDKAKKSGAKWYVVYWITSFDYPKYLEQCKIYNVSQGVTDDNRGDQTVLVQNTPSQDNKSTEKARAGEA